MVDIVSMSPWTKRKDSHMSHMSVYQDPPVYTGVYVNSPLVLAVIRGVHEPTTP